MQRIDRRNFLFSVGAAAASSTVSASGRARDLSAGGKIRAGLLGTQHGHTEGKLKTMRESPDYEVLAVCEPDQAARAERQQDPLFKGLSWVTESELLSHPSVDLVVAECRIWEAIPWGQKVIDANKHLHLEKPPGHEMDAFQELVEEARRKKLLLQMGYVWRFHEGITAAFEAARKGWLGDVYMIRGTINKDLEPDRRGDWARYKGGTLFELGGHVIDRVVDLWGRPSQVKSWLRNDTLQDGLADNTLAVLEYPQGLAVVTSTAWMAGSSRHRSLEVIGTDGSFVIQPLEPGTRVQVMMREARGPYQAGWQEIRMPRQDRYTGDFQDLARALKSKQPLKYSYDFELLVQETLLRASGEIS